MISGAGPAIFLDRDGVLNYPIVRDGLPYPPVDVASLRIYEGARDALDRAKAAGFALIVVTNQPDIARGTQRREIVDQINVALSEKLPIDEVLVCEHDSSTGCECRKPNPGLIFEGARRHAVDLSKSYLIGDRWRDIDAGAAAGVTTIMIDRGYAEREPVNAPDAHVSSLEQAIAWILKEAS
jgi:D-glycero-D-manno-heptose 1,7-bisphosphate phosphatase